MKLFAKVLLVIMLSLSFNVYAAITCAEPKLSKPTSHDSIFYFKTVVECNITGASITLPGIKDAYRAEILSPHSQFKVHAQHDYDNNQGMKGYLLDVTQSYNTPQGHLVAHDDIYLMDDNSKNFYMELKSKSIDGEDDAAYNKSIINKINLQLFADHAALTSIKEIEVEEPWYAPDSMFFDTVEPELMEASRKAALLNARKISGEQVDALRK